MEKIEFNRDKVIERGNELKSKRIAQIIEMYKRNGIESKEEEISNKITVKYLGKMEFTVEGKDELTEKKDTFMTIEEIDGQFEFRYYDEDLQFLGRQSAIDMQTYLSQDLFSKSQKEQEKILKQIEEKDKEEAKTIEELEEEKRKEEPNKLPGVEEEHQLSKVQVNRMTGPKTKLNDQIIDGETLRNVIGLEGKYMMIVDADTVRKLLPDANIPTNQRTVPLEVFTDGTANVIGEDKLQFSHLEGTNSIEDHFTMTNEGTVKNEQNIETYNIVKKGGMHTIAVGYDENLSTPLEMKYGRRDAENPRDIAYAELETVHEGPLKQDDKTQEYQEEVSGIYKGQETIDAAVEKYARAMNIKQIDEFGYPTKEYDLDLARQELESRWSEDPEATLDEIIEEDQKQIGPEDNRRI